MPGIITAPRTYGTNASGGTQSGTPNAAGGSPSRSDFLRLLTEQLRHQDPLNPMEDKDMMSQLAQFSSLEETQSMRAALDRLATGDQVAQGAALLGKTVSGTLPAGFDAFGNAVPGRQVRGAVSGVTMQNGQTFLRVGLDDVPLTSVTRVEITAAP